MTPRAAWTDHGFLNDAANYRRSQLLRSGWFRPVHVKTIPSREQRTLLAARSTLMRRQKDIENSVRGLLKGFGLRLGRLLRGSWDDAVREIVSGNATLASIIESLLVARQVLREQLAVLDGQVREVARADVVCRRLMTAPGVGAVRVTRVLRLICRCRLQPSSSNDAASAASTQSSRQSIPPSPSGMNNLARDPTPSRSFARALPVQTCSSSCAYRLHLLKS